MFRDNIFPSQLGCISRISQGAQNLLRTNVESPLPTINEGTLGIRRDRRDDNNGKNGGK